MITKKIVEKVTIVAQNSNVKRAKMAAILFTSKGQIITFSSNKSFWGDNKKFTIHAEEAVIAKAVKNNIAHRYMNGQIHMLVVRWMAGKKQLGLAKPCIKCQALIKTARLDTVFYTNANGHVCELTQ